MSVHPTQRRLSPARRQADLARQQQAEADRARYAAETDPEWWAARLGFADLAAIRAHLPERLHPHLEQVMSDGTWLARMQDTAVVHDEGGHARPARGLELLARIAERASSIDQSLTRRADNQAWHDQQNMCAVLGRPDPTTEWRRPPWGGESIKVSALGAAILADQWLRHSPVPAGAITRARDLIAEHAPQQ